MSSFLLVVGLLVGFLVVATAYHGSLVWPAFFTGSAATAIGVFLALLLERELERRRLAEQAQADALVEEGNRLADARLGFAAISEELGILDASLLRFAGEYRERPYLVIDLPTGSWEAARGRLGLIVSDFELIATLSRFYGRISDLRYWLALKAQAILLREHGQVAEIDETIEEALGRATEDVRVLTERIVEQIQAPAVLREPTRRVTAAAAMPYESSQG
jgi:hypothetical protein